MVVTLGIVNFNLTFKVTLKRKRTFWFPYYWCADFYFERHIFCDDITRSFGSDWGQHFVQLGGFAKIANYCSSRLTIIKSQISKFYPIYPTKTVIQLYWRKTNIEFFLFLWEITASIFFYLIIMGNTHDPIFP